MRNHLYHFTDDKGKNTIAYYVDINQDETGVWISHFLVDADANEYIAIPFDPDRFMTMRDFKWLVAFYRCLGYVMKPMEGQDFIRNGQTSLIASTIGIKA